MPVLTSHDDVLTYLTIYQPRLRPVARHVADELKLRRVLLVVLDLITRHLQRAVEDDEERQLVTERRVHTRAGDDGVLKSKHTWGVVRRSRHHAGEGQRADMRTGRTAVLRPRVPLLTADALLRHQVRVRALQTRGHSRLVVVDGYMVLGGRLDDLPIMPYYPLRAVELIAVAGADERGDITRLNCRHAVFLHELISGIQISLVLVSTTGGLVVADDGYTKLFGIRAQGIHVVVRIRGDERETVVIDALVTFPSRVPALSKDTAETVLGCELQIPAHVLRRSAVAVTLAPRPLFEVHRPPDAEELHGLDPRCIIDLTGLIEIEHDTRRHHLRQRARENHEPPWRHERRTDISLVVQHLTVPHPRCQVCRKLIADG